MTTPETSEGEGNSGDEGPITQEHLNFLLNQQKKEYESKFAGFDDLRSKAEQFDALTETAKTEAQRAQELADKLQRENEEYKNELAWRDTLDKHRKIAADNGLPSELIEFVKGETDEEITASVKKLAAAYSPRRVTTGLRSGSTNDSNTSTARRQRIAEALRQVGNQ